MSAHFRQASDVLLVLSRHASEDVPEEANLSNMERSEFCVGPLTISYPTALLQNQSVDQILSGLSTSVSKSPQKPAPNLPPTTTVDQSAASGADSTGNSLEERFEARPPSKTGNRVKRSMDEKRHVAQDFDTSLFDEVLRTHTTSPGEPDEPNKPSKDDTPQASFIHPERLRMIKQARATSDESELIVDIERTNDAMRDEDHGKWLETTNGFALRYLNKFGYRGSLGKDEQGRVNPISVDTHNRKNKGLGYTTKRRSPSPRRTSSRTSRTRSNRSDANDSQECRICNRKFNSVDGLQCHIEAKHFAQCRGGWKCPDCDRIFDRKKKVRLHIRDHLTLTTSCSFCTRRFKSESQLKSHLRNAHRNYHTRSRVRDEFVDSRDHHRRRERTSSFRGLKPRVPVIPLVDSDSDVEVLS